MTKQFRLLRQLVVGLTITQLFLFLLMLSALWLQRKDWVWWMLVIIAALIVVQQPLFWWSKISIVSSTY